MLLHHSRSASCQCQSGSWRLALLRFIVPRIARYGSQHDQDCHHDDEGKKNNDIIHISDLIDDP